MYVDTLRQGEYRNEGCGFEQESVACNIKVLPGIEVLHVT